MKKVIWFGITIITSIMSSFFVFAAEWGTKSFSSLLERNISVHFDIKKEIPSPVFSYTGTLTTWTTKAILKWEHWKESESFSIATSWWEAIALSLRLDHHNIWQGKNRYTLSLWKHDQLSEIRFFNIDCNYEEKQFGDATLYINEQFTTQEQEEIYLNWETNSTEVYPIYHSYLVRYGNQFYAVDDYFTYSTREKKIYEYRNLGENKTFTENSEERLEYGDLYINGALLLKNIPLVYHDTGAGNSLIINYKQKASQLDLRWGDGDGGSSFTSQRSYQIPSGKLLFAVDVYNDWWDKNMAIIENPNKKLEVFSLSSTGDSMDDSKLSLKYQYYVKKDQARDLRMEDVLVKDEIKTNNTDLPFGEPSFSYSFNSKTNLLRVERDRSVGGKAEVYVWNVKTFPIFYKSLK